MDYQLRKLSEKTDVKNYEGSMILPYLKSHKLTYHGFMDASRRNKTPGSEVKDSLLQQ